MSSGKIIGIVVMVVGVIVAIFGVIIIQDLQGVMGGPGTIDYFLLIAGIILGITGVGIVIGSKGKTDSTVQKNSLEAFKQCPFCANNIKREAIVCQFCGKDLPESVKKEIEDTKDAGNIEGTNYVVVDPVDLRAEPILAAYNVIALLSTGTKLTLLEKGEKTIINNTEGYWLKVQERFYGSGWCFSGNLTEEKNYIA